MIPTEDVTEGWYIARPTGQDYWQCVEVVQQGGGLFVNSDESEWLFSASLYDFHSRIPMPDATPEETPEERKDDDGKEN